MNYNIIFISPHLDDVVYSCSQMIRNLVKKDNKILVITLFTKYDDFNENIFLNGKTRKKEDSDALLSLNVDYLHLDYPELMIRDKLKDYTLYHQIVEPIRTLCYVKGDTVLYDLINQDIQKIIDQNKIKQVYFPAAIGFHPDHLITYRGCCNLKNTQLIVYQDFPYCNQTFYKYTRMFFIRYKKHISVKVDPKIKKEDILKYKSQFDIIFEDDNLDEILKDYNENYYII